MKVAVLTTVGDRCGIAAYTRELVAALRALADVTVEPIEPGRQSDDYYRAQAARLNQADVVHVQHEHSFWGGIMPGHSAFWTLRYLIEKPFVITAHTTTSLADLLRVGRERRPIHRIAKELLIRRKAYRDSVDTAPFATKGECIVHTREGADDLLARGVSAEHLHVIPAGVPPSIAAPTGGADFRKQFGLGDRILITIFGFLSPNKGYELALAALPELPADVHLVIAGGPRNADAEAFASALRGRITASGMSERVVITGYLSDVQTAEAMAASEVVLVPHTEATGSYSVTIPLAYGKPIVASDLACFREIQESVPCLRLFRSRDAAHFTACLKAVLNNAMGRAEMSARALRYAEAHSWAATAVRTVEVYEAAIRGAREG